MQSNNSLSNLQYTSELFDLETLKMLLKNTTVSRTSFYFESKTIHGFKNDLQEEIQDLLTELSASEDNLTRIIKIFLLFIDKHEALVKEKDEQNSLLASENERLILKFSLGHKSSDNLVQENFMLLEKNSQLSDEINMLDMQCQKYEKIIEELKTTNKKEYIFKGRLPNFDINQEFLENYEKLKKNYPSYFCKCFGELDEIKQQNLSLREKLAALKLEIEEANENVTFLKQKLQKVEHTEKCSVSENLRLKNEMMKIQQNRHLFISEIEEMSQWKKSRIPTLRMRSLSYRKSHQEDEGEKYPRISRFRKKQNKTADIENIKDLRENVRRKTRAFSNKYTTLLSEIQMSLEEKEKPKEKSSIDRITECDFDDKPIQNVSRMTAEEKIHTNPKEELRSFFKLEDKSYSLFGNFVRPSLKSLFETSLIKKPSEIVAQDGSLNAIGENELNGISSLERIVEIENVNHTTPPKFSRKTSMKKYRSTFVGHSQSDHKKNVGFVEEGQGNQGNEGINQHKMRISQGNSGSNVPQSNLSIEEPVGVMKEEIRKFEMVVDEKKEIKRKDFDGENHGFEYGENTTNTQIHDQIEVKNEEGSNEQENHQNDQNVRLNDKLHLKKCDFEKEENRHDNCQAKQRIYDNAANISNILIFFVLIIINLTNKILKGLLRMGVYDVGMIGMGCLKFGMVFGGMVLGSQVSQISSFIKCVLKFRKK